MQNVVAVAWSPRGTYLQTFERPSKEQGNAFKNLKVRTVLFSRIRKSHTYKDIL